MKILGLGNISLKENQYEVLKLLVVEKKDVLAVLPTGYGKSLIYQLLPPVLNFMNHEGRSISSAKNSTVLVISPLNTLIRDQIVKMREGGLNVCVLKGDRVTGDDDRDDVALNIPVENYVVQYNIRIFQHTTSYSHIHRWWWTARRLLNCWERLILNEKYKRSLFLRVTLFGGMAE